MNRPVVVATACFALSLTATVARADPVDTPAATAPPVVEVPVPPTEITFDTFQARMTVPVEIAGAGPYRFVVDTGAQRTVISHQLAAQLNLPPGPTVRLTAMSGTSQVPTSIITGLSVSRFGGERIEAPRLDARHIGASGILGIDTLQGHAVAINFDDQTMSVRPSSQRREEPSLPGEIVVRARSLFGQLVVTTARMGGRRVRVILDTGTAVSMGNLALMKRVARNRDPKSVQFISVTGGTLNANYATIRDIKLGEATINDLTIAFADAPPFRAFGLEDQPALLLGMDALSLFRRVDIDFARKELRLTLPRSARRF